MCRLRKYEDKEEAVERRKRDTALLGVRPQVAVSLSSMLSIFVFPNMLQGGPKCLFLTNTYCALLRVMVVSTGWVVW